MTKVYGEVTVVNDFYFEVQRAEIFGLVDHNGAGKRTTIKCLGGFRAPTSGRIRVLGFDAQTQTRQLRQRIGIQHQHAELPDRIKVWEAPDVFLVSWNIGHDVVSLRMTSSMFLLSWNIGRGVVSLNNKRPRR